MKNILLSWALPLLSVAAIAQKPAPALPSGTAPFVLGVVDTLYSKLLHEKRVLNIYLPEGYSDTARYPVVYLLDGSADEDFIHVVGLYQFNTFPWINRVPKSIIVGIANTDRKRDFTFPSTVAAEQKRHPTGGHSDEFIRFLETELQPYIAQKYRSSGFRTLIGQSLGGLLATQILLTKPALFDHYIIISPSLWWSDGALLNAPVKNPEPSRTGSLKVYIGVGKEGVMPSPSPHVMEVDANMLAEKLRSARKKPTGIYLDYLPDENHATIGHQALFNALKMLYPGKAEE